jgi:hypothetical protein
MKRKKIIQVQKDGNCFFHCLAHFLKKSHSQIRKECVEYFLSLEDFVLYNNINKNNIEKLANDRIWNCNEFDFIPYIASQLYKRTIHIHQGKRKFSFVNKSQKKEIHLRLENCHYDILVQKRT